MTCKQFVEGGDDEIKMVLTWMDGWYKGDEDEAIIDTDVFVDNAKKFGKFCAKNPTISIVNAAEKILGKNHVAKSVTASQTRSTHRHRLVVGGAGQRDPAKAHGAPEADDARIGQDVRRSRRRA